MRNSKKIAGESGKLIVGILTDEAVMNEKGSKPVLSFEERISIAEAIKYVDIVVPQDSYSPIANIKMIKPDILMESDSHNPKILELNRTVMEEINGEIIVLPYYPEQSSSNIKKNIVKANDKNL